jgi:hypothetical protein
MTNAIAQYTASNSCGAAINSTGQAHILYERDPGQPSTLEALVDRVEVLSPEGAPKPYVATWDAVMLRVHFTVARPVHNLHMVITFSDRSGFTLSSLSTNTHFNRTDLFKRSGYIDCKVDKLPFGGGLYQVGIGFSIPNQRLIGYQASLLQIKVEPADIFAVGLSMTAPHYLVNFPHCWGTPCSN